MSAHTGPLEAVDRVMNRGGADVLAQVAGVLHARVFAWVAVRLEDGTVLLEAGDPPAKPVLRAAVVRRGLRVAELQAAPREPSPADAPLIERVATLVSAHLPA